MLILVGVTINVALNGSLFTNAEWATSRTTIESEKEQLLESMLATMTDGEVHFDKAILPYGFSEVQGKQGVYTGKSGTIYTVIKNPLEIREGEVSIDSIVGTYYTMAYDKEIELKDNGEAVIRNISFDSVTNEREQEELFATYVYDSNNKTVTIMGEAEDIDSTTGEIVKKTYTEVYTYLTVSDESGNVINSILEQRNYNDSTKREEVEILAKEKASGIIPLTGYIYQSGTKTLEFSTSTEDGNTFGIYVVKENEVTLESCYSGTNTYAYYNGTLIIVDILCTISEDFSTITIEKDTYTKQQ